MKKIFRAIAGLLALFSAATAGLLFLKNKLPGGMALWAPKLIAGALTPFAVLSGVAGAVLGAIFKAPLARLAGVFGAAISAHYLRQVIAPHDGFEKAFGADWEAYISSEMRARLPSRRWTWMLQLELEPRWQKDIPFWTMAGTERKLLCDVWQPPESVTPSGLAFIYFHGSAWVLLDKDTGTRTFFRYLAGQGHVVMDVAYRLAPETGMDGMVGDVKRAIAWMKTHAAEYGVNPGRIVLGGGSAGGHLAMLAAYAPDKPELTPQDVRAYDLSVRGVVSEYGPSDLRACYFHTNQDKSTTGRRPPAPPASRAAGGPPPFMKSLLGENYHRLGFDKNLEGGNFKTILGGHPHEVPEIYELYSPVSYVHPGCPPTLLLQGEDDMITPVEATRALYQKLVEAGVPAVNVVFPQTDHGFDLALPKISPTAQAALYDIDRFLALMASSYK
jgi:acetyl esterase/lipase